MNNIKKNSLDLPFIYELLSFVSSRTVRGEDKQMRPCKCRNACPCQWMETSTRTLRQRKIFGVSIRRTLREFSQFKDGRELALPTPADTAPYQLKRGETDVMNQKFPFSSKKKCIVLKQLYTNNCDPQTCLCKTNPLSDTYKLQTGRG